MASDPTIWTLALNAFGVGLAWIGGEPGRIAVAGGASLGTVDSGNYDGQRLVITNVGTESFEVNSTPGNVTVGATRTVAAGGALHLTWDGTNWVG